MILVKLLALDLLQVFNIEANRNSIYHAPLAEMGLLIDMRHESLDCLLVFLADNDLSKEISFVFGAVHPFVEQTSENPLSSYPCRCGEGWMCVERSL